MAYTFNSVSLGIVTSERDEMSTEQMVIALPEGEKAEAVPLLGVSRYISITGVKKGSTGELQSFISQLKTWITYFGKSDSEGKMYNSDLLGSIRCKIQSGSWGWDAGNPNSIDYELKMFEIVEPT